MIRRDFLIGSACLVAAAGAAAMKPRHRTSLLGNASLEKLIPPKFGSWESISTGDIVRPDDENDLAAKLYSQTVGRTYFREDGTGIMLLIAYGDTQNDLLQLHRPETCYPAFGFNIVANTVVDIPFGSQVRVPARSLTATRSERAERILYWTRIGENLPTSNREQRYDKFRDQLAGIVPDGVLVRISNLLENDADALELNRNFAKEMIAATAPVGRRALIGTERAKALSLKI